MKKTIKTLPLSVALLFTVACSSNYEVGDLSAKYCESTDEQAKESLKQVIITLTGYKVPVDYCAMRGLIDVMRSTKASTISPVDSLHIAFNGNVADMKNNNFERM